MKNRGDERDLFSVILSRLLRKPEENVPRDVNMVIEAPFQALKILKGRYPFIHFLQLPGAQAFNARLHALHAALRKSLDLALAEVALRFDKHVQIQPLGRECPEQIVDIFQIDNIIDQSEPDGIIPARKIRHFTRHLIGRLGTKLHRLRIQPAKRAVMFLPPPASAGAFIEQDPIQALRGPSLELP